MCKSCCCSSTGCSGLSFYQKALRWVPLVGVWIELTSNTQYLSADIGKPIWILSLLWHAVTTGLVIFGLIYLLVMGL